MREAVSGEQWAVSLTALVLIVCSACSGNGDGQSYDFKFDWGKQTDVAGDGADGMRVVECPEGLTAWPDGRCAAAVGPCDKPWELPLVGGGCLPIGPRACPKGWGEAPDAACESGEVAECPEGFLLTDDEIACVPHFTKNCEGVEIPVLGGGCVAVGPQWEVLQETGEVPYCPSGHINLPDGNCAQVGPRACSRLWDPDSAEECQAGDLLDCPEGWIEIKGGLACEPVYDKCPAGKMPVLGGGCKDVAAKGACPQGKFPDPPDEIGNVVFVDASSDCQADCGSQQSPYGSVQQAVNSAVPGDAVLLAAGTYDEGVVIDKPLFLAGLCASKTRLTGVVPVEHSKFHLSDEAVVAVLDTQDVIISGLGLAGSGSGVVAIHAKSVLLEEVEIDGPTGGPLELQGKTTLSLSGVWVHDAKALPETWSLGSPVVIGPGAQLDAFETLIEGFPGQGIHAEGTDASVKLAGCVVRGGTPMAGGDAGMGLLAAFKADVELTDCVFEDNTRSALEVAEEATLKAIRCVFRSTKAYKSVYPGTAVETRKEGNAHLLWSILADSVATAAGSFNPGSALTLERCLIKNTKTLSDGTAGMTVAALLGGHITVTASMLVDNLDAAVSASIENASVVVEGTIVTDTGSPAKGSHRGVGLDAEKTGTMYVTHSVVERSTTHSVLVFHEGSRMVVENSVIRESLSDPLGEDGFTAAVFCAQKGEIEMRNTVIENCVDEAITVEGAHSTGLFGHVVVRDVVEGTDPNPPSGFATWNGGRLTVEDSLVENIQHYGIEILGEQTGAEFRRTVVRDITSDEDGYKGGGAEVYWGAKPVFEQCLFERNGLGLGVGGTGTDVTLTGCSFRHGSEALGTLFGEGMQVFDGARVTADACVFEDNIRADLVTFDPGTYVVVQSSVMRDTKAPPMPAVGSAARVWDGSRVDIIDSLLERNVESAVFANNGAQLLVKGTTIRDTGPGSWGAGAGISVLSASARVSGSLLANNLGHAIVSGLPETTFELKGSLILDTALLPNGALGSGFVAVDGGTADILASRIAGNHTAGILVEDEGTSLSLRYSVVSGTGKGYRVLADTEEKQSFGDGLYCGPGGQAEVVDSYITGSSRCGAYFYKSAGSLSNSVVWGNDSYGLAMDQCNGQVGYKDGSNHILGNAKSLPDTLAVDVTTTPGSLPPPSKPAVQVDEPDDKEKEPEKHTVGY